MVDKVQQIVSSKIAVSAVVLVLLGITARDYGLTIDEPIYIDCNERLVEWLQDFHRIGIAANLTPERLAEGWYYGRPECKSLSFVSVISTAAFFLGGQLDSPLVAFRWGNLFFFALTCGFLFEWVSRVHSKPAALVALIALLGTPRIFANANLLSIDPLVGCFWILCARLLTTPNQGWSRAILFAVLCGIGMTTKPTFWFALPGWFLFAVLFRRWDLWRFAVAGVIVAPVTFFLFSPMWWNDPVAGIVGYVDMLRNDPVGWKIDAYYLGDIYQAEGFPPLPWHGIPVTLLITTPVWITLLAGIGSLRWLRSRSKDHSVALWILGAITLPAICMFPSTPAHDGVRLYLTSLFFVAMLAGTGFEYLSQRWLKAKSSAIDASTDPQIPDAARRTPADCLPLKPKNWRSIVAVTATGVVALASTRLIHPLELSFYNSLVGGLNGAAKSVEQDRSLPIQVRPRFEITFWWDALHPPVLQELQQHLPSGSRLWLFPEHSGIAELRLWKLLRDDIEIVGPESAEFVLIYGRLGRVLQAQPLDDMFLRREPVWEYRHDDTRILALFRWQ